jgi:hypothetical protein
MANSEVNVNNAATIIAEKADEIIREAVAGVEPERQSLATHLIRKELWDHLIDKMGFGPDELREAAYDIEANEDPDDAADPDPNDNDYDADPSDKKS